MLRQLALAQSRPPIVNPSDLRSRPPVGRRFESVIRLMYLKWMIPIGRGERIRTSDL